MRRPDIDALRLRDRARAGMRVLFVGINPGVRSALVGHHFAGYSNRFWKLLHESGLVPELLRAEDDDRLPEFGLGITNLVARPTPGIDTLRREEYADGLVVLRRGAAVEAIRSCLSALTVPIDRGAAGSPENRTRRAAREFEGRACSYCPTRAAAPTFHTRKCWRRVSAARRGAQK